MFSESLLLELGLTETLWQTPQGRSGHQTGSLYFGNTFKLIKNQCSSEEEEGYGMTWHSEKLGIIDLSVCIVDV